eukprot:2959500-Prymnesium_polylepis.1
MSGLAACLIDCSCAQSQARKAKSKDEAAAIQERIQQATFRRQRYEAEKAAAEAAERAMVNTRIQQDRAARRDPRVGASS